MKKYTTGLLALLIALSCAVMTSAHSPFMTKNVDGTFEYVGPDPSTYPFSINPNNYVLLTAPGCPPGCSTWQPSLCGLRNIAIGLDGKPIITQQIKDELGAWFSSGARGPHLCFKF